MTLQLLVLVVCALLFLVLYSNIFPVFRVWFVASLSVRNM